MAEKLSVSSFYHLLYDYEEVVKKTENLELFAQYYYWLGVMTSLHQMKLDHFDDHESEVEDLAAELFNIKMDQLEDES